MLYWFVIAYFLSWIIFLLQEFPLKELFTHEVPLVDIDRAFELAKQLDCVKVVIKI